MPRRLGRITGPACGAFEAFSRWFWSGTVPKVVTFWLSAIIIDGAILFMALVGILNSIVPPAKLPLLIEVRECFTVHYTHLSAWFRSRMYGTSRRHPRALTSLTGGSSISAASKSVRHISVLINQVTSQTINGLFVSEAIISHPGRLRAAYLLACDWERLQVSVRCPEYANM